LALFNLSLSLEFVEFPEELLAFVEFSEELLAFVEFPEELLALVELVGAVAFVFILLWFSFLSIKTT